MAESLVIPAETLSSLSNRTLFYPCSGDDWRNVVQLFAPEINRFWFADICYQSFRCEEYAIDAPDGLVQHGSDSIIEVDCEDVVGDRYYRGISPFIRRVEFRHQASERRLKINLYMRRGPSALRSLDESIGIFLYRGDSNEVGSGTEWLVATKRRGQFRDVLKRLVDGGLIITDGSNPGLSTSNPYAAFGHFLSQTIAPQDAAILARPFTDASGNCFNCIGYIDCPPDAYKGPVLIWQLKRSNSM